MHEVRHVTEVDEVSAIDNLSRHEGWMIVGNNMVFPKDLATGSELINESSTEEGFRLALAKSRYLDID